MLTKESHGEHRKGLIEKHIYIQVRETRYN